MTSKRVASLSLHRNTIERKAQRERSKALVRDVEQLTRQVDIRAYAIVGIGADGLGYAYWDTGAIVPMWGFADTMAAILRKDVDDTEAEEDWKPPLPKGLKDG